jgi:hypothetical protein
MRTAEKIRYKRRPAHWGTGGVERLSRLFRRGSAAGVFQFSSLCRATVVFSALPYYTCHFHLFINALMA